MAWWLMLVVAGVVLVCWWLLVWCSCVASVPTRIYPYRTCCYPYQPVPHLYQPYRTRTDPYQPVPHLLSCYIHRTPLPYVWSLLTGLASV